MARISVCSYPWDLTGDPAIPERLARFASVGTGSVAIAAAYHSVRAATPLHPSHRVVDARHSAFYLPVEEERWGRLTPPAADAWAGADSFTRAAAVVRSAGLDVEAWLVLTHSSWLGYQFPELCVRNAFGDVYGYALCPSHPEVVDYAVTLVEETVRLSAVTSLMVEASGPLGFAHAGHHEKTAGADWSTDNETLLSICFCVRCGAAMDEAGIDVASLASRIRTTTGSVEEVLGDDTAGVLEVRSRSRTQLTQAVRTAARACGVTRLSFHAQVDQWAVGPFAALLDERGTRAAAADAFVLPGGAALRSDGEQMLRNARSAAGQAAIAAYVSALPPATATELSSDWASLVRSGYDELYVYHLGLLSAIRLDGVVDALATLPR